MKPDIETLFCLITAALLSGCIPEQRVIWSPDGRQAMVLGRENNLQSLYLCDGDGTLSSRLFDHVHRAAWRPDSKGVVLVCSRLVSTWPELESVLTMEEKNTFTRTAGAVLDAHHGRINVAQIEALGAADNFKNTVKLYLRHHHPDRFPADADALPMVLVNMLQTGTVDGQSILTDRTVFSSTMPLWGLRVSPDNRAVAYTTGDSEGTLSLYVASLDDRPLIQRIAENVSLYADWSADGQYVAYAVGRSGNSRDLTLGAVARTRVADASGQLLQETADREELAGLIMNNLIRVRCMPDGNIVFSAFEVSLPSTVDDLPEHMTLFTIHPSRRPIVSRLIPRHAESRFSGDFSMFYEFSPDFAHIVFPDDDDGLAILHVATGALRHPELKDLAHLPSWRSADELCYSYKSQRTKYPAVVLYAVDKENAEPEVISRGWPAALLKSLVDGDERRD